MQKRCYVRRVIIRLLVGIKIYSKTRLQKKYKDGTRFEDIVELYYYDEGLRQLFLKYLIKVENEIKSEVSYYFTEKNGDNQSAYLDIKNDTVVELSDREAWIQNKIVLNSKGNNNSDYERGMADAYRDVYDKLIGTT